MEAPGAGFDVLIATPKSPGDASYSLSESPDVLIIQLVGGELALELDDAEKMVKALNSLRRPHGDDDNEILSADLRRAEIYLS